MVNSKRFLTPKKRGGSKGSRKRMRGGTPSPLKVAIEMINRMDTPGNLFQATGEVDKDEFNRGISNLPDGQNSEGKSFADIFYEALDVSNKTYEGLLEKLKETDPDIVKDDNKIVLSKLNEAYSTLADPLKFTASIPVPSEDDVTLITPGVKVELHGLNKAEMNGVQGVAEELFTDSDGNERWKVKKDSDRKYLTVKPINLRVIEAPSTLIIKDPAATLPVGPEAPLAVSEAATTAAAASPPAVAGKPSSKNPKIHAAFLALDNNKSGELETQELKNASNEKLTDLIKAVFDDDSIKAPAEEEFKDKDKTVESFVYVFDNDGDQKLKEVELIENQASLIKEADVKVNLSTEPADTQQFKPGDTPFADIQSGDNEPTQKNKIEKTVLGDYFDSAVPEQERVWQAGKMIPQNCYGEINNKYFNKTSNPNELLRDKLLTRSDVQIKRSDLEKEIKSIVKYLAKSFGLNDATSLKNIEENLQLTEEPVDDNKSTLKLDWANINLVPSENQLIENLNTALSSNGNKYKITEPDPEGSPYYHLVSLELEPNPVVIEGDTIDETNQKKMIPKKVNPSETPAFKKYLDELFKKKDEDESTSIKKLKSTLKVSLMQSPSDKILQVFRYLNLKAFIGTSLNLSITTHETRFNLAKNSLIKLKSYSTKLRTKKSGMFATKSSTAESDLGGIVQQLLAKQSLNDMKKKIMVTENQFSSIFERALGVNSEPYGVEAKVSSYHSLTKTIVQKAIDAFGGNTSVLGEKTSMKIGDLKSSIKLERLEAPFDYLSVVDVKKKGGFVEKILHDADINGDGNLTKSELEAYRDHLSKDLIHKLHELIRFVGLLVCTISRIGGTNTGKRSITRIWQKSEDTGFILHSFEKRFGQALVVLYNLINDLHVPSVFTQNFTYQDILPNILEGVTNLSSNMDRLKINIQGIYGEIFNAFKKIQGSAETEDWGKDPKSNNQLFGFLSLLILKRLNKDGNLNSINHNHLTGVMFNSCYKKLFDHLKGDVQPGTPMDREIDKLYDLTETQRTAAGGGPKDLEKLRQTLYTEKIYPPLKTSYTETTKIDLIDLVAPSNSDEEKRSTSTLTPQSNNMYNGRTLIGTDYGDRVYCYRKPFRGTYSKYHTTGGKNSKKRRSKVVNSKKRQSTSQQKQTPKRKTAQQQSKTKSKSPQQQQKKQQKKQQQKQSQQKKNTQAQKKSSKNGKK